MADSDHLARLISPLDSVFTTLRPIGIVLSVVLDHDRTAKGIPIGSVFVRWLLDGVSRLSPRYEWVGVVTPSRYLDETAVLGHLGYALLDAGILLAAFLLLVGIATVAFALRDI